MTEQGGMVAGTAPVMSADRPEDTWDLGAILAILRRRQWLILLVMLMSTGLGAIITFRSPVLWPAKATLIIQSDASRFLGTTDPLGAVAMSEEFFQTQYRRITSQPVLERAIEAAGLKEWPEYAGIGNLPQYLATAIELKPIRDSHLVEVTYEGPNAEHAAQLVTAVVGSFENEYVVGRRKEAEEGVSSLGGSIEQLEAAIGRQEGDLRHFMQENSLVSADPAFSMPHVQLQELTRREMEKQLELSELEAQVNFVEKASSELQGLVLLDNPTAGTRLQAYDQGLTNLLLEREKALRLFAAESPEVHVLDRQIEVVRGGQRLVAQQLAASMKARRDCLKAALKETTEEKVQLTNAVQALNQKFIELERLRASLRQTQDRYQELLAGRARGQVFGQMTVHPVVVVERPTVAEMPSKPRKALNMALSLLVGLVLGVGLAFVLELLDESVGGADVLEAATGLQCLTVVPYMKGIEDVGVRLKVVREHPHALASEALRALRATVDIAFPAKSGLARVFLVSSAHTGEGKTTVAANLALTLTHNDRQVLLVDADMRHRTDYHATGFYQAAEGLGLAEYLAGEQPVESCIRTSTFPHLDILPAGKTGKNAGDLVGHARMEQLLTWARTRYDVIVLDTPPVLLVSDALVLSPLADAGIIVVGGGKTPRTLVAQACRVFQQGNFPLVGTVLNDATGDLLRASRRYGYYYGYRYGYGRGYGYGYGYGYGHEGKDGTAGDQAGRGDDQATEGKA